MKLAEIIKLYQEKVEELRGSAERHKGYMAKYGEDRLAKEIVKEDTAKAEMYEKFIADILESEEYNNTRK